MSRVLSQLTLNQLIFKHLADQLTSNYLSFSLNKPNFTKSKIFFIPIYANNI